ncbi:MAG TPA: hypothetical protein VH062_13515 [Polyangiaceae bacterium]|jgi:hypothetical protein|nr:hypothetical protein [Polyangiaceae bacterium]
MDDLSLGPLNLTPEQFFITTDPKTGVEVSRTAVFDCDGTPRTTITKTATAYTAIVEVTGLAPTRGTNADERAVGITSLDPPTVTVRRQRDASKSLRALIDGAVRAVMASATSTTGETGGPGGLILTVCHVTRGVRNALRYLGEEI